LELITLLLKRVDIKTPFSIFLCAFSTVLLADEHDSHRQPQLSDAYYESLFKKLRSNEPNYFVLAKDNHDQWHNEFNLSIQYPLHRFSERNELLLIYSGTYDFYFGSRKSSPVVSRRQNPGVAIHHDFDTNNQQSAQIRVGWYHESNGQIIDTKEEYDRREFAKDYISRGWDYTGINYHYYFWDVKQELDLRLYCDCQAAGLDEGREDQIFWTQVDEQPSINDYDGIRWKIDFGELRFGSNKYIKPRVEFKLGNRDTKALENVSTKLTFYELFYPQSPFTLFFFNGYGKEIATYHERNSYIGFGFELR
jgi:outer membrane phospholipase A